MRSIWKVDSSEEVFKCPWFYISKEKCTMPNGNLVDEYYITSSTDIVTVVPFDVNFDVFVLNEYKHGIRDYIYTFPSGMMEKDETSIFSANRELLEETGYTGELSLIQTTYPNPTGSRFKKYTFIATNIHKVSEQNLDDTESIVVEKKSIKEIRDLILTGKMVSDLSISSFYLALERIGKIKF